MKGDYKRILIHLGLFITTFICTTLAGTEWINGRSVFFTEFTWADFQLGMHFSIPFILVLTVHEFGHYFTARYYNIDTSLPYYIPIPPIFLSIGTMGAIIRMRGGIKSKQEHFDVGIAGPLAGFVVAIALLIYGFTHLPPPEYIFQIHPEYQQYGLDYAKYVYQPREGQIDVLIGSNLLMDFFSHFIADPTRMPNPHEMMHYPYLFAGFLSLIITSINLIPVGQLDGGHILYGLFGHEGHRKIARVIFIVFIFYAGLGYISPYEGSDKLVYYIPLYVIFLYFCFGRMGFTRQQTLMVAVVVFAVQFVISYFFPAVVGYSGWLLFGFVIGRIIGIHHPRAPIETPLTMTRQVLGWIALLVFVISFSMHPIEIIGNV